MQEIDETVEVDRCWIEEVLSLLERIGRDANKVVQPERFVVDAHRLLIQFGSLE